MQKAEIIVDIEPMKILAIGFTGVPYFENDVGKEAEARGHTMDFVSARSVSVDLDNTHVDMLASGKDMTQYDVIHFGAIRKNRWPLIAMASYLKKHHDTVIVDDRLVSCTWGEYSGLYKYLTQHDEGIRFPRSLVFKKVKDVQDKLATFEFPVIIKTNSSRQGLGVGLARNVDEIVSFVKERGALDKGVGFVLRERIPNDGDYRVNVVDGKAVICLKRTPKAGEYRSNISLGGTLTNVKLEDAPEICAIAEKISNICGFDISGVDVMVHAETGEPYILEVNRAPGSLEDDVEASGVSLAKLFVNLYEKRLRMRDELSF